MSKCNTCRQMMADKYGYVCTGNCKDNKALRKAFHKLALKHHPDKGGDEQEFKSISECHRLLYEEGCEDVQQQEQEQQEQQDQKEKQQQERQAQQQAEDAKFAYQYAASDVQPEFPPMSARTKAQMYQEAMRASKEAEEKQRARQEHWRRAQVFKQEARAAYHQDVQKRMEESRFRHRVSRLRRRLRPQTQVERDQEQYLYQEWRKKEAEIRRMQHATLDSDDEFDPDSDDEGESRFERSVHWWEVESDDDEETVHWSDVVVEEEPGLLMRAVLGLSGMFSTMNLEDSDSDDE
ncbi:MAG: DnaJ domain-containing protein [Gammaproteobacteria bacterium]|nr:DnaJ domain-containing protein [Gammaproteobacteria bacterium]